MPLLERGPVNESTSFRLIMIEAQLGLLQEGILFNSVVGKIRSTVTPGQSGHSRDVGDAHLLLDTLVAEAKGLRKPLWAFFGDLEKAFPRTWRQAVLQQLCDGAHIKDGNLALLGQGHEGLSRMKETAISFTFLRWMFPDLASPLTAWYPESLRNHSRLGRG